jgi:hypothetical protein
MCKSRETIPLKKEIISGNFYKHLDIHLSYEYCLNLQGIVSRKFAMLLLVPWESKKCSTPFLFHPFFKISSFSCQIFDYEMFQGFLFIKSQNMLLYRRKQFVHCWKIRTFSYKILLPVQIKAQTRYHIWASFIHGGLFLLTQDTIAEHLIIENSTWK